MVDVLMGLAFMLIVCSLAGRHPFHHRSLDPPSRAFCGRTESRRGGAFRAHAQRLSFLYVYHGDAVTTHQRPQPVPPVDEMEARVSGVGCDIWGLVSPLEEKLIRTDESTAAENAQTLRP